MQRGIKILIISWMVLLILSACRKDEPFVYEEAYDINDFIFKTMKEDKWYYWYYNIPDIQPETYTDPNAYLEALKYKEKDKWSYLSTRTDYTMHFEEGRYIGYGFGIGWDENNDVRISFVYEDSPADIAGITRGYKIMEVNGESAQSITDNNSWNTAFGPDEPGHNTSFKFEAPDSTVLSIDLSKDYVTEQSVLHSEIFTVDNVKTGYMVLKSFIEPTEAELEETFSRFQSENISELIVDLRYNPGGRVNIAAILGSYICGNTAEGQVFAKLSYNKIKTGNDHYFFFQNLQYSLSLERAIFITSASTASASELVINSLFPFMEVAVIGDDTHGKPVGMNSFKYGNYVLLPVCFHTVNASNEGDYFNGIPADAYTKDGLNKVFGDTTEPSLQEAVYYIRNNSFSQKSMMKSMKEHSRSVTWKGLRAEIGAF